MSEVNQEPMPPNPSTQDDVMAALYAELKAFVEALEAKSAEPTQASVPEIPEDVPRFIMEY